MNGMRTRSIGMVAAAALVMMAILPAALACTEAQAQTLQGTLVNMDTINGKATIVAKDGRTHVIAIDSATQIQVDGRTASLEAFDRGAYIEIELRRGSSDVAQEIELKKGDTSSDDLSSTDDDSSDDLSSTADDSPDDLS